MPHLKFPSSSLRILAMAGCLFSTTTVAQTLSPPSIPSLEWLEEVPEVESPDSSQKIDFSQGAANIPGSSAATYVDFSDFSWIEGTDTARKGNWEGVHGSVPPHPGVESWHRVTIPAYEFTATLRKTYLDPSIKEAWASYSMQIGTNWTPTDNVKLPGFSGHHNGSWTGVSGGNGGGWGGLCKSWSARTIIVRPSEERWSGRLVQYVYHHKSENFHGDATAADHPCINSSNNPVQSNKRQFGETFQSTGHITDSKWHEVTHHVKLNDIGEYNGFSEVYLDGELVSKAEGLNFTNNPEYHNIAFWFIVYHGGSADKSGTEHDVFFHNFRWNAGPVNLTSEN